MTNSTAYNIRLAKEDDAHAIATVHVASWQKIYRGHLPDIVLDNLSITEREQQWHDLIKHKVSIFVVEIENNIVGFTSICPSRDHDTDPHTCGEISAIYLDPLVWHQGLGKQLCHRALTELTKMGFSDIILWVLQDNNQARRFYESMGFINTGDIKAEHYANDVILNEIRYRKDLV